MEGADIDDDHFRGEFSTYCVKHVDRIINLITKPDSTVDTASPTYMEGILCYFSLYVFCLKHELTNRLINQLTSETILTTSTEQLLITRPLWVSVDTLIADYLAEQGHMPATTVRFFYNSLARICFLPGTQMSCQTTNCSDQEAQKTIIHDIRGTKGIIIGAAMLSASMPTSTDREQFTEIIRRNLVKLTDAYSTLSGLIHTDV